MYILFGGGIYINHSIEVVRLSVDLHGSSIQHLALSLCALFQDEDGFLSV